MNRTHGNPYTPKHSSWFEMAESERSVFATRCLDRRIPDPLTLTKEVTTWERQRNAAQGRVDCEQSMSGYGE